MNELRSSSNHAGGDTEKMEDVILPGFRFHPTDEELVGFYLKRKIQHRPLSIELIKQLDIYKYDPWDLPKVAGGGEKEWYFYCPRDRKYRNSTRPNRVTGAGFWKATGTDRPIYSSDGGTKCIGLKKSLVFYKGRAAKGVKTDWMMHEFRLPSLTDSASSKRFMDKSFPPNDSWAICKIFKKANSGAQRSLSHSWVSPNPSTTTSNTPEQLPSLISISSLNYPQPPHCTLSTTTTTPSILHFCPDTNNNNNMFHCSSPTISSYTNYSTSYNNKPSITQNLAAGSLNLLYPNLPEASNYSIAGDNHHHHHHNHPIGVGVGVGEENNYSYGVFPFVSTLPVISNTLDLAWKSSSSSCSNDDCTSGGYSYSAAATKSFYAPG